MGRVWLVRHGRAAAGWDTDPDPGLDALGREQAAAAAREIDGFAGPGCMIASSPLRRCQETAAAFAALRGAHGAAHDVLIEERVAEIPTPDGVAMKDRVLWLRGAMAGEWSALGPRYLAYRDGVVEAVRALATQNDTTRNVVVFSHFIAINAVIGSCLGDDRLVIRSLDNCSITTVDVDGADLRLVVAGREADTLIR